MVFIDVNRNFYIKWTKRKIFDTIFLLPLIEVKKPPKPLERFMPYVEKPLSLKELLLLLKFKNGILDGGRCLSTTESH